MNIRKLSVGLFDAINSAAIPGVTEPVRIEVSHATMAALMADAGPDSKPPYFNFQRDGMRFAGVWIEVREGVEDGSALLTIRMEDKE